MSEYRSSQCRAETLFWVDEADLGLPILEVLPAMQDIEYDQPTQGRLSTSVRVPGDGKHRCGYCYLYVHLGETAADSHPRHLEGYWTRYGPCNQMFCLISNWSRQSLFPKYPRWPAFLTMYMRREEDWPIFFA